MYRSDCLLIGVFLVLSWVVLLFVLFQVFTLTEDKATLGIATLSAAAVGAFSSGALLAVLSHLKRRKESLYREDLENGHP